MRQLRIYPRKWPSGDGRRGAGARCKRGRQGILSWRRRGQAKIIPRCEALQAAQTLARLGRSAPSGRCTINGHLESKLYRYFNDIRVRSFILNGAPFHDRARYHALSAAAPASRMIPTSCGSPGREPRNPARDVGPEILVLRSEPANDRRLLVPHDKPLEGESHRPTLRTKRTSPEPSP